MYLFHSSGFVLLRLIILVSTDSIKMFAKATAIFVPITVPCISSSFFSLNSKEFSLQPLYLSEGECRDRGVVPVLLEILEKKQNYNERSNSPCHEPMSRVWPVFTLLHV